MPERYNACCERVGSTSCDAGPQTNPPRESASSEAASPWRSCELRRLAAAVRPRVTMTARVEGASGSKMQAPELRAVPRLRGSPSLASCLAKWILRIHPAQGRDIGSRAEISATERPLTAGVSLLRARGHNMRSCTRVVQDCTGFHSKYSI